MTSTQDPFCIKTSTPLHRAAQNQDVGTAQTLLLEKQYSVNEIDEDGKTPLHDAASVGCLPILILLLNEKGAHINAEDQYGWTPLHHAVWEGKIEAVTLLLNQPGIYVSTCDKGGFSPLDDALQKDYINIAKILFIHGATIGNQKGQKRHFQKYVTTHNVSVLTYLLVAGLDTQPEDDTDYIEEIQEGTLRETVKNIRENLATTLQESLGIPLNPRDAPKIFRTLPIAFKMFDRFLKHQASYTHRDSFWRFIYNTHYPAIPPRLLDNIIKHIKDIEKIKDLIKHIDNSERIEQLENWIWVHKIYHSLPNELTDMIVACLQNKKNIAWLAEHSPLTRKEANTIYYALQNKNSKLFKFYQTRFTQDWNPKKVHAVSNVTP